MRNLLLALMFYCGAESSSSCPANLGGGDTCGVARNVAVDPLTGELWALEHDGRTPLWYRSSDGVRVGPFGRGFAAPWEVTLQWPPDAGPYRTGLRLLDRGNLDMEGPLGFSLFPSPTPLPETHPGELLRAAQQVVTTLALSRQDPVLRELDPYVKRLERDGAFRQQEVDAQVRGWRADMGDAVKAVSAPPAQGWRVLLLPSWGLRYSETFVVQVFNRRGQLERVVDRQGVVLAVSRDGEGRVARVESRGATVDYGYDANGRVVTAQSGSQAATHYGYDGQGRLTRARTGDAERVYTWGAPPGWLLVKREGPDGSWSVTWDVDAPAPRVASLAGPQRTQHHRYEERAEGKVHATTLSQDGKDPVRFTVVERATGGRRGVALAVREQGTSVFTASFDPVTEALVEVTNATEGRRLAAMVDERGRVVEAHLSDGRVRAAYAPGGHLARLDRWRGNAAPGRDKPQKTATATWDQGNRVVAFRWEEGPETRVRRDAAGRVEEIRVLGPSGGTAATHHVAYASPGDPTPAHCRNQPPGKASAPRDGTRPPDEVSCRAALEEVHMVEREMSFARLNTPWLLVEEQKP